MRVREEHLELWADDELLAAVADRNGAAFSVFYRRHLPAVLAYLVRESGDREQAADLCAEVFSAVLLKADRYLPVYQTALPWVLGIASNKLKMSFRRGRVEAEARRRLGLEPVVLTDAALERVDELVSLGTSQLDRALDQLPYLEREAVKSHVLDELDYRELAKRLECSEMVVRKRVSRGLKKLREQLLETRAA